LAFGIEKGDVHWSEGFLNVLGTTVLVSLM